MKLFWNCPYLFLIRQRNVGSVVTQSHDDEDSDDDEDEPNNEVFGVATVIKLNKDQVCKKSFWNSGKRQSFKVARFDCSK